MTRICRMSVFVTLAIVCGPSVSWSQAGREDGLKREIERRFDVLPLRDGLALHPKTPLSGIRSVEITGGTVAIDGQPASGAELRARLGAGADQILQLSYLSDVARRALFAPAPVAPAPRTPPAAPDVPVVAPPPPSDDALPPRPRRPRFDRRNGDRVRIGGDVTVEEGEVVDGDVVAVGGAVRVDGEVQGDVVSVGGGVTLGPRALVERNVTVVGGALHRDPGAQVKGKAQEVSLGGIEFGKWSWRRNPVGNWWGSTLGSAFAFVATLARVAVLCLLASLVVLFGRGYMERAGEVAAVSPVKALAVGFMAQILFLPLLVITIVVLAITIVGIPLLLLLPFAILALVVAGVVGFTGVASRVGSLAASRLGWQEQGPYAVAVTGVLILMLPVLLSRLASVGGGLMFPLTLALGIAGGVIEYLAWTIGFGAMALLRYRGRADSRAVEPGPAA